jgi:hypothetical protein
MTSVGILSELYGPETFLRKFFLHLKFLGGYLLTDKKGSSDNLI